MLFRSGLLELLSSLGLVSKIVLLILLIFSIGSWTVILYKWRFFRRQEAADLRFLKTYRRNESPLAASRDLHLHRDSSAAAVFAEVARCYQLGGNGNPGSRDRPPDPVDLLHRVVDRDPLQVAVLPPSGGRGPAFPENLPAQRVSTRGFPRSAPAPRQLGGRGLR